MKGFVQTGMVLLLTMSVGCAGFLDYKRYQYDVAWNIEFGDDGPLSSCYFKLTEPSSENNMELDQLATYCVTVWMATYQEFRLLN